MANEVDGYDGLGTFYVEVGEQFDEADYEPLLRQFLQDLEVQHSVYFSSEISPGGTKWPTLEASTIQRKGHDTILFDTGRLRDSLTGQGADSIRVVTVGESSQDFLVFGTSVPYSHFHQDGSGQKVREHVGVNETVLDIFADKAADVAVQAIAEE